MSPKITVLLAAIAFISLQACEDTFVGTSPGDTPTENFDAFWKQVDRHYAFFELKGLDWDSVRTVYRPQIDGRTTDPELLQIYNEMIQTLRDGHVNLYAPNETLSYDAWYQTRPENFEFTSLLNYVSDARQRGTFFFGEITPEIGYLFVDSFSSGTRFSPLDEIMRRFANKSGLIIDIRSNGGGNDLYAKQLAGYFVSEKQTFGYIRWRNGSEHDDFTDWIPVTYTPAANNRFSGNVVILTNRRVFSTSEFFLLMMKQAEKTTIIGDTTGGGSGNPRFFKLPNGWNYRVSRWQAVDTEFRQYEGRGIYPDIPIWNAPTDSANGIDTILERAIDYLSDI